MRHINRLFGVQLCGLVRAGAAGPRCRAALERSVGAMYLSDWKGVKVGDPVPYFRSALATINPRNATNVPGQTVVEEVLSEAFKDGFSATLDQYGLTDIHTRLGRALGEILHRERLTRPVTAGFRDMVLHLPRANGPISRGGEEAGGGGARAEEGVGGRGGGGGAVERCALEDSIGGGFIDFANGYVVGDIAQGFAANGGTDVHISYALSNTFGSKFETTLSDLMNRGGPGGGAGTARFVMTQLAQSFGAALRSSLAGANLLTHPDPVFSDLTPLISGSSTR
jgi:hypothetical protein